MEGKKSVLDMLNKKKSEKSLSGSATSIGKLKVKKKTIVKDKIVESLSLSKDEDEE